MDNTSVRPADDIERVVEAYGNTLFKMRLQKARRLLKEAYGKEIS